MTKILPDVNLRLVLQEFHGEALTTLSDVPAVHNSVSEIVVPRCRFTHTFFFDYM